MPDVRSIDAVQDEIGETDRIDQVLLLATPECLLFESRDSRTRNLGADLRLHVLRGLGEKSSGAAARVVNRFANLRVDRADHRSDHFARCEELASVRSLFAH